MGNCFTIDDTIPENTVDDHPRSTASSPSMSPAKIDPPLVLLPRFPDREHLHGRRRRELFGEAIPPYGDEMLEVFKKIRKDEETIGRLGFQLRLKRSHSAGAAEAVAKARGVDLTSADLKNERFKVKTFDAGDKPPPAEKGGGKK